MFVMLSSAWSLYGLPSLKQSEQEGEEPSEESPEETEEEGAMAAQSTGAGAGKRPEFTLIWWVHVGDSLSIICV